MRHLTFALAFALVVLALSAIVPHSPPMEAAGTSVEQPEAVAVHETAAVLTPETSAAVAQAPDSTDAQTPLAPSRHIATAETVRVPLPSVPDADVGRRGTNEIDYYDVAIADATAYVRRC